MAIPLFSTNVLVIGGGMAGLSAASAAAMAGVRVVLVESGHELGGSAALSGGFLWTAPNVAALRERDPGGDPSLAALVVDSFPLCLNHVAELGTAIYGEVTIHGWGRGHQIDIIGYLRRCQSVIESSGTPIVFDAVVHRLLTDDEGRVTGALVEDRDGAVEVTADTTVLATGGFQADGDLRAAMIGPQAAHMLVRSNGRSKGDGLRLAMAAGAAIRPGGFYGHVICRPVDPFGPAQYIRCAQYHSEHALLLNLRGERFVDESHGDHIINQELLAQPESRAILVADDQVWSTWGSAPAETGLEATDRFHVASEMGANVAMSDTVQGLVRQVEVWGYPQRAVATAIARHNDTEATDQRPAIVNPPFRAVEVQPSITFPFTGIAIDKWTQVLDRDGQIVEGLLAAGADTGGAYARQYGGGLALAMATGLRASKTAVGAVTATGP